jgi:hypothetical protein
MTLHSRQVLKRREEMMISKEIKIVEKEREKERKIVEKERKKDS